MSPDNNSDAFRIWIWSTYAASKESWGGRVFIWGGILTSFFSLLGFAGKLSESFEKLETLAPLIIGIGKPFQHFFHLVVIVVFIVYAFEKVYHMKLTARSIAGEALFRFRIMWLLYWMFFGLTYTGFGFSALLRHQPGLHFMAECGMLANAITMIVLTMFLNDWQISQSRVPIIHVPRWSGVLFMSWILLGMAVAASAQLSDPVTSSAQTTVSGIDDGVTDKVPPLGLASEVSESSDAISESSTESPSPTPTPPQFIPARLETSGTRIASNSHPQNGETATTLASSVSSAKPEPIVNVDSGNIAITGAFDWHTILVWLIGFFAAATLSSFVGCLQNPQVGLRLPYICLINFYAVLQASLGVVTSANHQAQTAAFLIFALALILKVMLFAVVEWALDTNRIFHHSDDPSSI